MHFNKYSRSILTLFIGSIFIISGILIRKDIESRYNSVDEYVLKSFPNSLSLEFINKDHSIDVYSTKRPLFVHFWATWCGPCEAELPEFIKFSNEITKANFIIIASKDDLVKVQQFIKRLGPLSENVFHVFDETGSLMKAFGTLRLPETYFFDSKLDIVKKFVGPQDWSNQFFLSNFKYLSLEL